MCKIKSHWMFSVVFFMFYIRVICDCVCVLKYAIYLIWPRQFSFGPDSSHLAHVFLIWLIPWPEQKMSQRGPCFAVRMKKPWALSYPLSASEDSDQTGWMPRLIWVFAGRTLILFVLSCRGYCVLRIFSRQSVIFERVPLTYFRPLYSSASATITNFFMHNCSDTNIVYKLMDQDSILSVFIR